MVNVQVLPTPRGEKLKINQRSDRRQSTIAEFVLADKEIEDGGDYEDTILSPEEDSAEQIRELLEDPRAAQFLHRITQRMQKLEQQLRTAIDKHNARCDEVDARDKTIYKLRNQVNSLQTDLDNTDDNLARQIQELQLEKAALEERLSNQPAASLLSSPLGLGRQSYSVKMPDPKKFSGPGDSTDIDHWIASCRRKLDNTIGFASEKHKIDYIASLLDGDALEMVDVRLMTGSVNPYQTVEDVFRHLTKLYGNPDKVRQAKNAFRTCYMKKEETFHQFYSRLMVLHNKGHMADDDLVFEINDRLLSSLQAAVAHKYVEDPELDEFVEYCTKIDNNRRQVANKSARENRFEARTAQTPKAATPTRSASAMITTPAPTSTPFNSGTQTRPFIPNRPRFPMDNNTYQMLTQTRACYNCKEVGHRAKDCPKNVSVIDTEVVVNPDSTVQSGKENA